MATLVVDEDLQLYLVLNTKYLPQLFHQLLLILIVAEGCPGSRESGLSDVCLSESPGLEELHLLDSPAPGDDGEAGTDAPLHVVLGELDDGMVIPGERNTPCHQAQAGHGDKVNLVCLTVLVQGDVLRLLGLIIKKYFTFLTSVTLYPKTILSA